MDSLVLFLIEEGYADDYRSAEKILECISDEFYEELLEALTPEERARKREEVARKRKEREDFYRSRGATPPSREELQRSIRQGKPASRGQSPATRATQVPNTREMGPSGTTQRAGSSYSGSRIRPMQSPREMEAWVTKRTGIPAERRPLSSTSSPIFQRQDAPGRDPTRRNITGRGRPPVNNIGSSGLEPQTNRYDRQ